MSKFDEPIAVELVPPPDGGQDFTPAELAAAMQSCAESGDVEGLTALRALAKRLAEKKPVREGVVIGKDKLGRRYKTVDGKHVPLGDKDSAAKKPAATPQQTQPDPKPKAKDSSDEGGYDIDDDDVEHLGDPHLRHIQEYHEYDYQTDDVERLSHDVYLAKGTHTRSDGKEIDVYRWEQHRNGDDVDDHGDWTTDETQALRDGKAYAQNNHEEQPSPEDDNIRGVRYVHHDDDIRGNVVLEAGSFSYGGEDHDVYRWRDTSTRERGNWHLDRGEAYEEGRDQSGYEDEDEESSDEEDIDIPENSTGRRDVTLTSVPLERSQNSVGYRSSVNETVAKKLIDSLCPSADGNSEGELAACLGMPDDAAVKVIHAGEYKPEYRGDVAVPGAVGVRIRVTGPQFDPPDGLPTLRFIGVDPQGDRFIKNESLELHESSQGSGLGASIFSRQVEAACQSGFSYISTHAAKGGNLVGYITWPKFGYDMSFDDPSIDRKDRHVFEKARELFGVNSIQELFETEGGEEWWCGKKNPDGTRTPGNGTDLYNAKFDLTPGSKSMRRLAAYLKNKKKK